MKYYSRYIHTCIIQSFKPMGLCLCKNLSVSMALHFKDRIIFLGESKLHIFHQNNNNGMYIFLINRVTII
jgi:hypothetical protein